MVTHLASDLIAALERTEGSCELVDGKIVAMTPSAFEHARVLIRIGRILDDFATRSGCGTVIGGDPGFIWDASNVRAPDVALVAAADVLRAPGTGFIPFGPLLAVEVVSPSDAWRMVERKARGWIEHGAHSVWVVDPVDRLVVVHGRDRAHAEWRMGDTLIDPALPGFASPVAALFS
jgi:Uma2 family endonuclease